MKKRCSCQWLHKGILFFLLVFTLYFSPVGITPAAAVEADAEESYEGLELIYGDEELSDKDAFVLLMFGDGFTAAEQQDFYESAEEISEYMMNTSPWDEFTDTIKIYAYGTVSEESGARGADAATLEEANADTRSTYFGSTFWTGGMQRLLTVGDEGTVKVKALKEELLPDADFSVMVVNSETYGGSGGEVCVASLNSTSLEMMLHELGHTVADLGDEYWPGKSYAYEYANMTQESDPQKVKWARFIGKNGVGVYKYNQTETEDWYRPSDNCKMQYLSKNSPFCEVCKEELRKAFSKGSNVTKLFFQTYADEFFASENGKDMKEYFIIRKGENETTGDQLGDALTLVYKDADGEILEEIPSQAGTYTIEAVFAGDDTYAACELTTAYTIELHDLLSFDMTSKVYDGTPVEPANLKVDYDGSYTTFFHYTGTVPYTSGTTASYDSDEAPTKPGKYTVEGTLYDETGMIISKKLRSYQITIKTTPIIDNNDSRYPGAQDWYNNKHIVIVGEGFTAEEQEKFEELAQEYAEYILAAEPFREMGLYFNFTSAEVISDASGIGMEPGNTCFGLTYDENGKIVAGNISAVSGIGYNNVSQYYKASIVIVNDENVKKGAVATDTSRGYIYVGIGEESKAYAAKELLNYLTGKEEGYTASTAEETAAQREELLRALYYSWYGDDYALVVSRAYQETFKENGTAFDLTSYFKTYVAGKEVPNEKLNYTLTYYDSEGNELQGAPLAAGTYGVLAELIPTGDKLYGVDWYGTTVWELGDDETVDAEGYVCDADGNQIGYLLWDDVTEVMVDGTAYHIPKVRGWSTFTIQPADKKDTVTEPSNKDETGNSVQQETEKKEEKILVSEIKITGNSTKVAAGKKIQLTAGVLPKNAAEKSVTWESGNTKVATVNSSGVVTMKKGSGGKTVIITATAKDGSGVFATYKIKSMAGAVKKISISGKTTVKAGKTLQLKAKVTADKGANTKVKWRSSNTKYADVSSNGKVKAYKAGKGKKVKITVEATDGSGKKKTVTIKIK